MCVCRGEGVCAPRARARQQRWVMKDAASVRAESEAAGRRDRCGLRARRNARQMHSTNKRPKANKRQQTHGVERVGQARHELGRDKLAVAALELRVLLDRERGRLDAELLELVAARLDVLDVRAAAVDHRAGVGQAAALDLQVRQRLQLVERERARRLLCVSEVAGEEGGQFCCARNPIERELSRTPASKRDLLPPPSSQQTRIASNSAPGCTPNSRRRSATRP